MSKYNRTADSSIYNDDSFFENPKECHVRMTEILQLQDQDISVDKKLIDLGCASGALLHYVRSINPNIQLDGVEYSQDLINYAKKRLIKSNINIKHGDCNKMDDIESNHYDFVTSSGVTCIFNDFEPMFEEMIRIAKPGARCINFIPLNEYDVDVIMGHRDPKTKQYEAGWNRFAISSIEQFLDGHKSVDDFSLEKQELSFDLPMNPDDLLRTWTVKDSDGKRIFWNGLNSEVAQYYITFSIK